MIWIGCWIEVIRIPQSAFRNRKRHLKRKWKAHIRFENYQSQDRVAMDAPRRQRVKV